MKRMLTRRAALAAAALLVLTVQVAGRDRRPITESDLLRFVWIADPQVSPDGSRAVFTRVVVNERTDEYETSIWIVPTSGAEAPRKLTAGPRDSSPRWAPDGTRLAFVRAIEKDGKPQPAQIYLLSLDGGEGRPLTALPKGAGAPAWSPDGSTIAFTSTTTADDLASAAASDQPRDAASTKSDVRVITEAVYRSNGSGWDDPERPTHIWVIDARAAGTAQPTPITGGRYDEGSHVWAPDGSRVFFISTRISEPYYHQPVSELFAVPASGGQIQTIAHINGTISSPQPSLDGRQIAFVGTLNGTPERSYDQSDLFVTSADGSGTPRNLTASYDFDVNGSVGGDQRAPRGSGPNRPLWSADGRSVLVVSGEQGDANLLRIDVASGRTAHVHKGAHTVQAYGASADGRTIVTLVSTQTAIGDLFVVPSGAAESATTARQITRVNDDLFTSLRLSEPEEVWWTSFDGQRIQGWLLHPPDFDRAKKYPFILEIHGGPHSAYGNVFTHEFQWMAAKGYVVLFPNPRGSSNYGQAFGNVIQYRYPGDDYRDLMAGVDAVLARGYIDEKRMGVTGGSGGGLLTNWTVTQTTRFAAAVSQRSIADWSGFWYTADFTLFTPSWFRKAPWDDPVDFVARSPITHVARVKTPLMLVDGDDDLRTPPSDGGEQMFRALKYLEVPTVMVRFPGETHELSRSGRPRHRVERLQHIVGWFDQWLQGKKDPRYETASRP